MTNSRERTGAPNSDELLRLIVESATDFAIFSMDLQGNVTSWNKGAERLLGYREEDMIGRSAEVVFTPEDRAAGVPARERAEAAYKGRADDERWHLRSDGSRFWGSGIVMPLADGSGFVKIFRDRTERRAAQERRRESEALFRLLATNVPQLVFRTKGDGGRTWGSPQWIVYTGLSLQDSLGFGWLEAVHPEDREATTAAWRSAQGVGEYYVEHRIRRVPDGSYRWHQTRAKPVPETSGEGDWVGTSTDVHEMRGMQERQRILLAELQHRTRNLLAVIRSIARDTMRMSASLEVFSTEFSGRLGALGRVQGLLARSDGAAICLREIVETELHAHGGGELMGNVDINGPVAMLPAASAQTFTLAIHELATNALKHGALGQASGKLNVTWRIEHLNGAPHLVLDWHESGVAMPPARSVRPGYGTELISAALPYQMGAETELTFGPTGVHCRITTALEREGAQDE
ncbi:PAS domain S-box protein [Roseomonas terrae]|jgi:PAS domain S-box-containing protein|uniref:histidine kinase n=1 Tax=Neoroseomonas terrae TaxID=424799 RepID=A0ABS5EDZ1_9PROT|nr:PAS domain S-box protein [Neoroseomonas terrae]MBR0649248.1 PAS domain S-box protein [Neoroseomonas terrae]